MPIAGYYLILLIIFLFCTGTDRIITVMNAMINTMGVCLHMCLLGCVCNHVCTNPRIKALYWWVVNGYSMTDNRRWHTSPDIQHYHSEKLIEMGWRTCQGPSSLGARGLSFTSAGREFIHCNNAMHLALLLYWKAVTAHCINSSDRKKYKKHFAEVKSKRNRKAQCRDADEWPTCPRESYQTATAGFLFLSVLHWQMDVR